MINIAKNEKGVTLVEILAVIVITALVAILIFNVQLSSSKQYNKQLNQSQQLNEVSYVLKVITKEMRKTTDISSINGVLKINNDEYKFDESTKTIKKNAEIFASNIESFSVKRVGEEEEPPIAEADDNTWSIIIENLDNKKVETKIVVRSGS